MTILIINGPNLNLLGTREPDIYGTVSFEEYFNRLKAAFPGVELQYFQSNHEGEIIDRLHEADRITDGIILNAGAFTHYSYAIADAIRAISVPVIEVHISNIFSREDFRHKSVLSPYVAGIISGFGPESYKLALLYFLEKNKDLNQSPRKDEIK